MSRRKIRIEREIQKYEKDEELQDIAKILNKDEDYSSKIA